MNATVRHYLVRKLFSNLTYLQLTPAYTVFWSWLYILVMIGRVSALFDQDQSYAAYNFTTGVWFDGFITHREVSLVVAKMNVLLNCF